MRWTIGRPINGITINGLYYACDENGITEDDLEDGSVVIVEEEDE